MGPHRDRHPCAGAYIPAVSLALFGGGLRAVVFAGLANNLLPLCQPGTTLRSLVVASVIVALTFFVIMLISITAAYLYGVFS